MAFSRSPARDAPVDLAVRNVKQVMAKTVAITTNLTEVVDIFYFFLLLLAYYLPQVTSGFCTNDVLTQ